MIIVVALKPDVDEATAQSITNELTSNPGVFTATLYSSTDEMLGDNSEELSTEEQKAVERQAPMPLGKGPR